MRHTDALGDARIEGLESPDCRVLKRQRIEMQKANDLARDHTLRAVTVTLTTTDYGKLNGFAFHPNRIA